MFKWGGCDINPNQSIRTKHMRCPKMFAKTEQVPFLSGFLLQNIACFRSWGEFQIDNPKKYKSPSWKYSSEFVRGVRAHKGTPRTKGANLRRKKKKPIRTCAPFYPRHQLKAFPLASSCSLLARHLLASLMEFLFNLGETLLPLMRLLIWCLRLALLSPRSLKRKKKNNQQQKKLGFEVLARFSQWGLEMLPGGIKFVSAGKCLSGNYQVSVWHLLL